MQRTITALLIAFALAASGAGFADTVDVPIGQQGSDRAGLSVPGNGQTMAAVKQHYGSPDRKIPAVGKPPITRWVYPQFTVYFEYNRVIHSVVHPDRSTEQPSS